MLHKQYVLTLYLSVICSKYIVEDYGGVWECDNIATKEEGG